MGNYGRSSIGFNNNDTLTTTILSDKRNEKSRNVINNSVINESVMKKDIINKINNDSGMTTSSWDYLLNGSIDSNSKDNSVADNTEAKTSSEEKEAATINPD